MLRVNVARVEHLAYAAHLHQMADQATDDGVRAAWLKLAGSWLKMAMKPDGDALVTDTQFQAMAESIGTGQNSDVSH